MRSRILVLSALVALTACTKPVRNGAADGPARGGDAGGVAAAVDAAGPAPVAPAAVADAPAAPPGDAGAAASAAGPTDAEKRLLLSLARAAIGRRLAGEDEPTLAPACRTPYLRQPLPCFVTLDTADGGLRGCIGMFESDRPLFENVMNRARAAAFQDGRFDPVQAAELPGLVVEISILTPHERLQFSSPQDLLAKLHPLVDGVILHSPWGESTFLPQVWEQLPQKEDFLGRLCEKHGAPSDCWRDPATWVEIYHAVVFGEKQQPARADDWFTAGADGTYTCTVPAGP